MDSNILNALMLGVVCLVMVVLVKLMTNRSEEGGPQKAKKAKSQDGVDKAVSALRRYATNHDFGFVAPVKLALGDKTVELDAAIVTYNGVVGVRCIGRNGEIFANPGDKEWLWVNGASREKFANPVDSCAADVRVLRDILIANGQRAAKVECHTVFTSSAVSLAVPKSTPIWRDSRSLLNALAADKYMEDKGIDKDAIVRILSGEAK